MNSTWECGTPRSQSNAFTIAPRGIEAPTVIQPKRGPKKQPRTVALPGSVALDSNGVRCVQLAPRVLGSITLESRAASQAGVDKRRAITRGGI